jgi:hypothetical protein
MDVESEKANKH